MVWFSLALTRCLHRIQNFSFCHLVTVQSPNGAWLFVTPMDCSMPGFSVLDYFPRVGSNSCPLGQGCYSTISSSVTPFSYCPQSFPASGSFPKLEWIAIPFPRGSSQPRDQTQVSKWQAYLYHLSHQGKTYIHLVSVKFSLWLPEDVRYNQTKCLSFLFKDERRETERLTSETCLKFGDSKVRGSEKDMDQKYYW